LDGFRDWLNDRLVPWTLLWITIAFAALAIAFAGGCTRTVLVPESSPVRIGPDCRARVYSLVDGEWTLSANRVSLPEGWYLVPPSFVDESKETSLP
jgi:hypothetical protein